jgi:hypothetical protein
MAQKKSSERLVRDIKRNTYDNYIMLYPTRVVALIHNFADRKLDFAELIF